MTAVLARNLHKAFGATRALDGLDLVVETGEVMGFLGPNGSGKSTTIRVLMGLMRHDAGEVELLGGDPWRDAVELHRRVAYVAGDTNLWPGLSGGEVIDLLARLGPGLDETRRAELIERFELDPTKKTRTYSKGNRQKVALVAALAGRAELLILDEPTAGLDPLMEAVFQSEIRRVTNEGKTVLLSSHILAEVEALCHRVTIIREGRTVETGSLAELRHLTRTAIEVHTHEPVDGLLDRFDIEGLEIHDAHRATFSVANDDLSAVIAALAAKGIDSLLSQPPTLEQLFLRHYGLAPDGSAPASAPGSTA